MKTAHSINDSAMRRILILLLASTFSSQAYAKGPPEGKTSPAIEAKLLDGSRFKLSEQTGKVVILTFWATWCEPCREEMPALETYYKQHKNEGLEIIAISMDFPQDLTLVKETMRAYTFPAAMKDQTEVSGYGRIWRMPMTFVIDRNGILRKDGSVGDPRIDLPLLEKIVTPLLAAKAQ